MESDPPEASGAPSHVRGAAPGLNPFEIALAPNPHALWHEIRESHPVWAIGDGGYFITSWEAVDHVLRDARHGAGTGVADSFGTASDSETALAQDVMRVWLMSLDGPDQTRARGLVRREFTPRRVDAMGEQIRRVSDRLVDRIAATPADDSVDLIDRLAFALPNEVIRSLFGFPRKDWEREIEAVIRSVDDSPGASVAMIEGLARAFSRRVQADELPDGLLSQLARGDAELGALSPLEVVANAVLLVTAAIDTTAGLIGNAIHCALERPAVLADVRRRPERIANLVEETLRFEPPALSCSRRAGVDFRLGGVDIPAGAQLLLGLAAANRDPARFAEPDRFRLDRDHSSLLSFGGGRHFCLGAALARLEARIVLERLLVDTEIDFERLEAPHWQRKNPTVRALTRLPVRVVPRRAQPGAPPSRTDQEPDRCAS